MAYKNDVHCFEPKVDGTVNVARKDAMGLHATMILCGAVEDQESHVKDHVISLHATMKHNYREASTTGLSNSEAAALKGHAHGFFQGVYFGGNFVPEV